MYAEFTVKSSKVVSGRKRYPQMHEVKANCPANAIRKAARHFPDAETRTFEIVKRGADASKKAAQPTLN